MSDDGVCSVDPCQTDYQGLTEVPEDGGGTGQQWDLTSFLYISIKNTDEGAKPNKEMHM